MFRPTVSFVLVAAVAAALTRVPAAQAQGNPPGTVTVSSSVTGIQQLAGDFQAGGDVQWSSLAAGAGVTVQFVPAFAGGLAVRYDDETWTIRSAKLFQGVAPWHHLERPGASLNLSLALSKSVVVGVSPTVDWPHDARAPMDDAGTFGAVVSAFKVFSPKFVLGGGASVTKQFYNVKTSPFVIVNWQLTDRLRVANAPGSGPLGGAGVELRYAPRPEWEVAGGGVWKSDRWWLGDHGPLVPSVGETSSIPLLARVSRKFGTHSRLDVYAGASFANKLTLRDFDGHEMGDAISHDAYATVPMFSASLSGKF